MDHNIHSSLERDELISRYLKGEMDSEEEARFLSHIESDEQLRQDAIDQALLVKGMYQVDQELIQTLKEASVSEINSLIRPRKHIFRKPVTWMCMAASVMLLIFAGYKGYDYYDTTRLGMKYAQTFPMETLSRGDSDVDVELELHTLFDNVVERKDLTATTERLAELWELANQDTYNDYTVYAPYIGWYLAIGYLEDYEKDKAIIILKQMDYKNNYPTAISEEIKTILLNII